MNKTIFASNAHLHQNCPESERTLGRIVPRTKRVGFFFATKYVFRFCKLSINPPNRSFQIGKKRVFYEVDDATVRSTTFTHRRFARFFCDEKCKSDVLQALPDKTQERKNTCFHDIF